MSKKRLPGLMFAALGIFLCLVGLLNSPTRIPLSPVWAFFVSVWESGILLQPGCIGIYGVMIFALAFNTILPREKRQRVREVVKQNVEVVKDRITTSLTKNPQHRPPIDDDEAVKMKLENPTMSYRQVYDHFYPPKQDLKEKQERELYFKKNWRSRVSQKVNQINKANARKHEM